MPALLLVHTAVTAKAHAFAKLTAPWLALEVQLTFGHFCRHRCSWAVQQQRVLRKRPGDILCMFVPSTYEIEEIMTIRLEIRILPHHDEAYEVGGLGGSVLGRRKASLKREQACQCNKHWTCHSQVCWPSGHHDAEDPYHEYILWPPNHLTFWH